jgi:hypothetical protein
MIAAPRQKPFSKNHSLNHKPENVNQKPFLLYSAKIEIFLMQLDYLAKTERWVQLENHFP